MQCLYWLVKEEIPHTLNYPSMLKAVEIMGCNQLKYLQHGVNAKYTSRRITHEFIQVMGDMIEQAQLRDLVASPVSLLIDETTDSNHKRDGDLRSLYQFTCSSSNHLFELTNGCAETIEEALMTYIDKYSIPLSHLVGFGSDGAFVMIGKHSGVAARIKAKQPILTSIHCVAHHLALAAGQAGDKVKFIADTFKPTLKQLFYFYENSPVRLNGLKALEELLHTPELNLKKPLDTWLSHDACHTLKKVLPAVIKERLPDTDMFSNFEIFNPPRYSENICSEKECLYSVEWNGGMERWNGTVEWNGGMEQWNDHAHVHCNCTTACYKPLPN